MKSNPGSPGDPGPELDALEAELRQDRLEDPGDAFFADMEREILKQAEARPVPHRPWWRAGLWQQLLRPAPVAALAGAAMVALVVLWAGGPGDPEVSELQRARGVSPGHGLLAEVMGPKPGKAPGGDAWLAQLPPAEELWAVEDKDLPTLLALLSAEVGDGEDELEPASWGAPGAEQSLKGLSEDELRALERLLDKQPDPRKANPKRPRPRPTMDRAG